MSKPHLIRIHNPDRLPDAPIDVERMAIGAPGDYKPVITKLPNNDLYISAYRSNVPAGVEPVPGYPDIKSRILEPPLIFRSQDGGRTWSGPKLINIAGKEPYIHAADDGTLFITTHIVHQNILNREDPCYCYGMLHRSDDLGETWTSMRAEPDVIRAQNREYVNCTTRFPLQLNDGSLLLAASGVGVDANTMMRSTDGGKTWPQRIACEFDNNPPDYPWPIMGEGVLWQARSDKIYGLFRVDTRDWAEIDDDPLELDRNKLHDQFDRLILCSTTDLGSHWKQESDFGRYGQMYPSILRLQDGRLLLTFTQRANQRPLGLRAVIGTEHDDGFEFDINRDVIVIDQHTPDHLASGGGFGCTVQLDDGTLVSSYSYRTDVDTFAGPDRQLHCEVARWRLPQ
jgi:hypothetical protein